MMARLRSTRQYRALRYGVMPDAAARTLAHMLIWGTLAELGLVALFMLTR